ncbi:hypothetical protein DFA_03612 [Cavenderia fasciculata]|uniref:Uncharacterized protein n=1 Tax=Cavenderia fasciculata TaxID=261658 RepID=F4PI80_CACFS|nr:uncharacterized protein DFA_03612 [Cavenderia fasciculata]EGG25363.1 hypothetical protein DFA_03612 [Cavenderia fasciculata]|eukprot:XP_004363214.1 hypothetical protein DFA_03612 [Cavenderia fasciculata]
MEQRISPVDTFNLSVTPIVGELNHNHPSSTKQDPSSSSKLWNSIENNKKVEKKKKKKVIKTKSAIKEVLREYQVGSTVPIKQLRKKVVNKQIQQLEKQLKEKFNLKIHQPNKYYFVMGQDVKVLKKPKERSKKPKKNSTTSLSSSSIPKKNNVQKAQE